MAEYIANPKAKRVLQRAAAKATLGMAQELQLAVKGTLTSAGSSSPSVAATKGAPPRVGTGSLRRSIQISTKGLKESSPFAVVGTNLVYARILEFGGVIVPKVKKFLAFIGLAGHLVMVKKVTINPHPYWRKTLKDSRVISRMQRRANREFAKEMAKMGRVA